ncbi:class II fructose-bisphosphate aldolase [Patescibacteria group bacterium]|nr:class II fructose-bisphosphate aldolase [Patescibacteria group bacterium]
MKTLTAYIHEAQMNKRAIAHFNVANSDMLMSIFHGAQEVSEECGEKIPVLIGVTEGERDAFGVTQIVDYITSLRNEHDYPIFVNADHTYSVERACEAIDAGFDMVIYDGANISHEENLKNTQQVVAYRNEVNPECLIEAEFGFIGSGSNIKDTLPDHVSEETMTDPNEAQRFVQDTGIDALAPSVGNVHGMVKSGNPALNPGRVRAILEETHIPLVLHGGSGSTDEDFLKVIQAGISIIHISTELRVLFRKGIEESFQAHNAELAPYRYFKEAKKALKNKAKERIKLFWAYK